MSGDRGSFLRVTYTRCRRDYWEEAVGEWKILYEKEIHDFTGYY
jgi:hypothetical protein